MRKLLPLILVTLSCSAQQRDLTWDNLQAIRPGASIRVATPHHHTTCTFEHASPDALACRAGTKETSFARADITRVQLHHRVRSTLVGTIPGDALAIVGAIGYATRNCQNNTVFFCGLGAEALSALGGAVIPIGAAIGAASDFTQTTIYRPTTPLPATTPSAATTPPAATAPPATAEPAPPSSFVKP